MILSSFTFEGKNSYADYGIITTKVTHVLLPEKRDTAVNIPFRSGSVNLESKRSYNDLQISVECVSVAQEVSGRRALERKIALWLSKPGKLVFEDEPDKWYRAEIFDSVPLEHIVSLGTFTLVFRCHPFAFSESKTEALEAGDNQVGYAGTVEAPCLIVLRNEGTEAVSNIKITAVKRR